MKDIGRLIYYVFIFACLKVDMNLIDMYTINDVKNYFFLQKEKTLY